MALVAAKAEVDEVAGPLYRKAFEEGIEIPAERVVRPLTAQIDDTLTVATGKRTKANKEARAFFFRDATEEEIQVAQQQARSLNPDFEEAEHLAMDARIARDMRNTPQPRTTIEELQNTKFALDEMLEREGSTAIERTARGDITKLQQQLVSAMREASPTYAAANDAFENGMQTIVQPLEDSIVGVLAKVQNHRAAKAAATLFQNGDITPSAMRMARGAFRKIERQNPELEGAWDGLVRRWLEGNFNKAARVIQSGDEANIAGKFFQSMAGRPEQRAALQEALGGDALALLNDTLTALQSVARTPVNLGSRTETAQQITTGLRGQAGKIRGAITSPLSTIERSADAAFMETQARRIAEALTDRAKIDQLRKLRKLTPSQERNIKIAGVVLGSSVGRGAESVLSPPRRQVPPILEQAQPQQ
jgi:hypothetical protein